MSSIHLKSILTSLCLSLFTSSCASFALNYIPDTKKTTTPLTTETTPIIATKRSNGGIHLAVTLAKDNGAAGKTIHLNRSPSDLQPYDDTVAPNKVNHFYLASQTSSPSLHVGSQLPFIAREDYTKPVTIDQETIVLSQGVIYWLLPQGQTLLQDRSYNLNQTSSAGKITKNILFIPVLIVDIITLPIQAITVIALSGLE